jgi:uncharacterized membrane protein YhaH (DUF805 family)
MSLTILYASVAYARALSHGSASWLFLIVLLVVAANLYICICRLRDMGKSPLLVLLLFVPVANLGLFIWLLFAPSA